MDIKEAIKELYKRKAVKQLVKALFNIELTTRQCEIVRAITYSEHKRIVISCMTRYGKSYSVSIGICLWILSNQNKKICIVAPTAEKTTIIRNYIANIVARSQIMIGLLDLDKKGFEKIRKEVSHRRMTWKNGIEMRTLSADGKGEALMGFGADLCIVDESCDIDYEVYRSKISRMLGDNKESIYIEIGNPWHRDNHMWQHWINPEWHRIHIGWDTALREGRLSDEFLKEQKSQLTDREFKILYEADFPEESEDQLIKYSWIQEAVSKQIEATDKSIKIIGLDVARSGADSTVITYGIKEEGGYRVLGIKESNQEDTMQTTAKVLSLWNEFKADRIIVDTNGLGAGVTDRLNELRREGKIKAEIIEFMSGESPTTETNKDRFLNKKAEAYFRLRSLFEEGRISIPKNPKLINELTKMKWELTSSGKIRILDPGQSKDDTSEEKSPDFADSLCYFCYETQKPALIISPLQFK